MKIKVVPHGCGEEYSIGNKEFNVAGNSLASWIDFCFRMDFCDEFRIYRIEEDEDEKM